MRPLSPNVRTSLAHFQPQPFFTTIQVRAGGRTAPRDEAAQERERAVDGGLAAAALLDSPCAHAVVLTPRLIPAPRFEIARLRGGQDDASVEEEEKDDLDMSDAGVVDGDDARVRLRLSLG